MKKSLQKIEMRDFTKKFCKMGESEATQSTYRISEAFLEVLSVAGNIWAHYMLKIAISQYACVL